MNSRSFILLSALGLTACQPSETTPAASGTMLGLTSSGSAGFTMTADGRQLSISYQTQVGYGPATPRPKTGEFAIANGFSLGNTSASLPLRAYVRGFAKTPAPGQASLVFSLDGKPLDLSRYLGDEDFTVCFDFDPVGARARIDWKAKLEQVVGESALISIDSIDISVRPNDATPLNPAQCDTPKVIEVK